MRRVVQVAMLIVAPMLSVSADEPPMHEKFPLVEKKCTIMARDYGGKQDWVARCKLRVYRQVSETTTEGMDLFNMPLIQAHPASYEEASKAVGKWLEKSSVELLRRNGYLKEEKKEKRKK